MKILTISSNDQGLSWGPAVHFLELWNAFSTLFEKRYRITGLVPSWTGKPCIKPAKFALRRIQVPNIALFRQIVFDMIASLYILMSGRTFIYVRLSSFHLFVLLALAVSGKPFCIELNGLSLYDAQSSGKSAWFKTWTRKQERWLVRKTRLALAVSKSIADYAENIGTQRVQVVPNSVSPDFYTIAQRQYENERTRVIYVGTYTSWDGSELIPELARRFPEVEFIMVGDGNRRKSIQECSPVNMTYTGTVPYSRLPDYYEKADAGIVLYEHERHRSVQLSSMKVLEYMAAGLPIFSTNVPGQEFIEIHGIGRLARNDNISEEFRQFLAEIPRYRNNVNEYRKTIGKAYSWLEAARITERAIREVLAKTAQ